MSRILLVRPGATDYDRQGRIQGTLDMPLCPAGREQVESALDPIAAEAPVAVYCSPCQAAAETADAIAGRLGLRAKPLGNLHNIDHGLWQGMLIEDVRSRQPRVYRQWQEQPETVCPPEGETILSATQRAAVALKKLLKKHAGDEAIVLVTPEPLASVVRHVLRRDTLGDLWRGAEGCGSWEAIDAPTELAGAPH
ncbi:MAG: histidine phosphatase family protein [Planctomycetota bacterium]